MAFIIRKWSMLYAAPDHLLILDTTGYAEEYRRFYYRDIEAITVHRTRVWRNRNLLWGILAGLAVTSGGVLYVSGGALTWLGYWVWGVSGCFALPLLLNVVAGPTCEVTIRSAIRSEVLPSLGRVRVMEAVLPGIRERILAAQSPGTPVDAPAVDVLPSVQAGGAGGTEGAG